MAIREKRRPAPAGGPGNEDLAAEIAALNRRGRREAWVRRLPLLPGLVYVILVTQIPFIVTLYYSFVHWNLLAPSTKHFTGIGN
ncbi:MAG: sugar ABC transporter permease, partial [Acidimicrobiales bacterium]